MGSLADIEGSVAALQPILAGSTAQAGFTSVKISPPPLGSALYAVISPGHHQNFYLGYDLSTDLSVVFTSQILICSPSWVPN